ncbi:uncharacterized protein LOC126897583 [Daktulosphaira vitifoliae]|uniref:uncharacterized protein LOC126897583 n=1 Tax=Daktulosphaira vitifoliae TaxID=58002 RepID=UPI0021AA0EC3|nr:uncharacterized protein LOC126897583 [Daktulosphaira vitifoliae]
MSDSTYAESKEIPFLPNVCVNTYELYFGQFSGCDMLTVTGLPNILFAVQVSSSNNSLVMPMIHSQSENSRVYSFNVNPLFWELGKMDIYILVTSEIIPQTINISIRTPFSKVIHDISKIISRNTSSHGSYFDSVFLSKFYISFSIIFLTIFYVCFYGLPVCLSFNTSVNDRYHRNGQDETGSNIHFVGFYNRSSSSCKDFQRRTKRYYF